MLKDYWLTAGVMDRGLGTHKELEEKKEMCNDCVLPIFRYCGHRYLICGT